MVIGRYNIDMPLGREAGKGRYTDIRMVNR